MGKPREIEVSIDNGENGREVSGGEVSEKEFSGEETDGEFDCEDELEEEARINDIAFDRAVDPTVEFQGVGSSANVQDKENQCAVNEEVNFFDEGTPHGSDEEVEDDIWPQFRACDMECPQFTVGMTFGTKAEFKEAIVNYAFKDGKDLKFVRNDKIRFVAKCKQSDCPWYITLRKNENDNCWRISVFNDKHECSWVYENTMVSSRRLAKKWKKEIGSNSEWKVSEFRNRVATDQGFHISQKVAYKAMKFARANLTGEMEDYFKKFWSYYLEIQRSNPNTTSIVKTSEFIEEGGQKRFLRWYICWEACKIGFSHCRKIIGVDGCHLRSTYGGYLLTATAMDPNDGIFPIAYALAEGESKESWSWFLALLKHDLRISESEEHRYTFVSDKQKGLIPAFRSKLSHVSHRFCVRHLYSNMKVAGFHGKAIKETLWAAARATTVNSFTEAMRKMKDLDVKAFDWLGDKHPSEWSRSHFGTDALCDILVNNVSECFNAMILDARSYPLISCLEKMRTILMVRLFKNKEVATKWSGRICPRILRKLAVEEKYAGSYLPIQCDLMLFEITGMHTGEHHKIDLARRSCSCKKWDLTGIPCKHAICAIWMKKHNVLDYVDNCYSIETYLKVYQAAIKPMAGPNEWPMTNKEPPLPPLFKTRPGRPKKLRKTGANENSKAENSKGKTVAEQISKDGIHISRAHVLFTAHCVKNQAITKEGAL
ncbi:uncharacterized protein LOC116005794 [Ipomoea triloba]|uniref:uncharacterized protein LOC116005794 n=1 Tax=Ipomoea triloba TaxID=35885 RepID=UPI00125D5E65|nr:uncharacterized protein LOC116005794 [Ipomoea triloba]